MKKLTLTLYPSDHSFEENLRALRVASLCEPEQRPFKEIRALQRLQAGGLFEYKQGSSCRLLPDKWFGITIDGEGEWRIPPEDLFSVTVIFEQ